MNSLQELHFNLPVAPEVSSNQAALIRQNIRATIIEHGLSATIVMKGSEVIVGTDVPDDEVPAVRSAVQKVIDRSCGEEEGLPQLEKN